MNASYLELKGIRKMFGDTPVLNNVDLSIREGELVTLLGPSGCGKSTLLRCIAGLTELDGGRIMLGKQDLANLPPRSREVGMVFQSYALFPNLTVTENIEYGLKMRGVPKKERLRRCEELLALVDLEDKRGTYPQHLSGGQQQRVALARSLAVQPKVLLLDEPLSALDAKIRKNLRTEIREIQKRLMMTTIFVTHDQEEALTLSDRICIMNKGHIVQDGTPEALYSTPRTEFVARFMGSYNVLTRTDAIRLFGDGIGMAESFAIRPESVRLLSEMESASSIGGKRIVEGKIDSITILGNVIRYSVDAAGVLLTIDILNDGRSLRMEESGTIRLALDPSQLLQLEKEGA
ncbi:ABC transporter ATP-binding protein [Cohnella silvisoli]|uniref:ABC transporter ATP-binding protein n=1 Tax=Cohnella silvisoli TaxID=2873699 RepID=A0ABV1KNW8_9BACL|nr:ABC transporter ATP-binding protein [Cohnella silvisoli]MCD9020363.1 ABC transporter ATP-binding protein [Cohnella silvisoli]